MRDYVVFYVNGTRQRIAGDAAFAPLVEFLREDRRLVGTKIGCGEGDCGACTVLIGVPGDGGLRYRPATSCLLSLLQLDGTHVLTVEGLKVDGDLSPIQRALIEHHGSQCGYCTPGFVVALTGLFEAGVDLDQEGLGTGLAGNLCRCTGYLPILDAARSVDPTRIRPLSNLYPSRAMIDDLAAHAGDPVLIESTAPRRVFFRPDRLEEAVAFKAANPGTVIIAGGTELGVLRNKQGLEPTHLLSLAGLGALAQINRQGEILSVGAGVTWAALEAYARGVLPVIAEMTRRFGSPQIRSVATLVGNIAHGSPVADSLCLLMIADAELELVGANGTRRIAIDAFYRGAKRTHLAVDEIITRVLIPLPLPARDEVVRLYKVSKRKEMDVSTFRAAVRIARRGDVIERAAIAYAGVGPTVRRLRDTENFLEGQPFSEETFRAAGRRAHTEVEPISDHRGSRDYKLRLAENILLKFFYDWPGARRQEIGVG
jgi:xanthine dehydrogenase small subunit